MKGGWQAVETLCVRAGWEAEPVTGAINTPLFLSSTFVQNGPGEHAGYHYARAGNPTRKALETTLAALEGARHAYAFASGCAATTAALLTLRAGDHVLASDDVYSGTYRLLDQIMSQFGLESTFVDMTDLDAVNRAIRPNTRMLWLETPTNPLLKILDLSALAEIGHRHGARVTVDNTFATPILQRPLEHGATIVVHSTTKYLNGHCDMVGGALVTNDDALAERLHLLQRGVGAVPSAFDCYLVLRGIKTLAVRMRQHVESAQVLAEWLTTQPAVKRVHYPGLPSHPGYELARRQMRAPGGMITLELDGDGDFARSFIKGLRLFLCAISLGGVESLVDHIATMTHVATPKAVRETLGLSESLVRLSVGLESVDELRADLDGALRGARGQ